MKQGVLRYQIAHATWSLDFTPETQVMFAQHVQHRRWSKESVGQLFTRDLTQDVITVELATLLKPKWSSFARVSFDPVTAAAERARLFKEGLHCIGWWHTHPEPKPHPSQEDLALVKDHALAAQPTLTGLAFAIVGTLPMPDGLGMWVHDGTELREALPQSVED
jgi:hypothetical protein